MILLLLMNEWMDGWMDGALQVDRLVSSLLSYCLVCLVVVKSKSKEQGTHNVEMGDISYSTIRVLVYIFNRSAASHIEAELRSG
jgi:hypothetical protein